MDSRPQIFMRLMVMLILTAFLSACQDTIPYRSTITPGSSDGDDVCTEVESEVTEDLPLCDDDDDEIVRPNNAILWKTDFCACKDSKPVSYGNCASFCSGKNTNGVETLFANFTVTEAISLSGLGSVYGWCKTNLPNDEQNPECEIEAKDDQGNITPLEISISPNSNSLTADIQSRLDFDKTYVLTLVERSSKARSNSIQLVKFSTDVTAPVLGPLKNTPVSQYACIVREFSTDDSTGDIYFNQAYRLHFYYIPSMPPTPIPAGNSNLICHDIFNPAYGKIDNELFPRFENKPGIFNVWDTTDPRFYDNNGNGAMDVNDLIIQKTKNFGGTIPAGTNFFSKFTWFGAPELNEDAGNTNSSQPLGYFMAPWIDQTTFKSYCLTSTQYNSNNPLFKAMRDVIGVDTEGLYIGEKAAETVIGDDGQPTTGFKDYVLIRETDLKAVWFYIKNGTPTAPTEENVANNAVYFYYPLNKASPYVKTSTQRIFRVRGAAELGNGNVSTGGSNGSGVSTNYPPHDRKIGCVPKF